MKHLINTCKDYTHLVDDDSNVETVRVNIAPKLDGPKQPSPVWVEFTGIELEQLEPIFGDENTEWADLYQTEGGFVLVKCIMPKEGPIVRQFEVEAFADTSDKQ